VRDQQTCLKNIFFPLTNNTSISCIYTLEVGGKLGDDIVPQIRDGRVEDGAHGLEKVEDVLAELGALVGTAQDDLVPKTKNKKQEKMTFYFILKAASYQETADNGLRLGQVDETVKVNHVLGVLAGTLLCGNVRQALCDDREGVRVEDGHDHLQEIGPQNLFDVGQGRGEQVEDIVAHGLEGGGRDCVNVLLGEL